MGLACTYCIQSVTQLVLRASRGRAEVAPRECCSLASQRVILSSVPATTESYIHVSGRTGRAGNAGLTSGVFTVRLPSRRVCATVDTSLCNRFRVLLATSLAPADRGSQTPSCSHVPPSTCGRRRSSPGLAPSRVRCVARSSACCSGTARRVRSSLGRRSIVRGVLRGRRIIR